MGIQYEELGEGDSNEKPQVQTNRRSRLIFGANLQSGTSPFEHSYYPYKMRLIFV